MSEIALRVEELSKRYQIGVRQKGSYKTLRDSIGNLASGSVGAFRRRFSRGDEAPHKVNDNDTIWALKDISFEVKRGEVIGLIGSNGSGKSTLLKILSRITEPTTGSADIHGRVSSLLEVGTGFHPELSGRENIYLNGAILGMRKIEIERKFDEIVAFSEVDKFIDTQVKHYSSGMYLRLAFAVAAHLEPEILLVDEVLAVGDAAFQRKCLGKMGEVSREGRTVILVSHNMASIARLSETVLWLNNGHLQASGDPESIIANYLSSGVKEAAEVSYTDDAQSAPGSEYIRLMGVRIKNHHGRISGTLDNRFPFDIEIEYKVLKPVNNLRLGITLTAPDSTAILSSKDTDSYEEGVERLPGTYVNRCTFPGDFLNIGQYFISIGSDTPMIHSHFFLDRLLAFQIEQIGGTNGHIPDRRQGHIRMQFPWDITPVEQVAVADMKTR